MLLLTNVPTEIHKIEDKKPEDGATGTTAGDAEESGNFHTRPDGGRPTRALSSGVTATFPPQAAAAVPRMLALRVRHGLQLQLKRKEQINRRLRKGLISTRRQLHLKQTRVSYQLNLRTAEGVDPVGINPVEKIFWFFSSAS